MLEKWLKDRFPAYHSIKQDKVRLFIVRHSDSFSLKDDTACFLCQDKECCDRKVLNIEVKVDDIVTVVDFERYLSQPCFKNVRFSERCDYLMVDDSEDHRKIVFCDLTCSVEKYVNPNGGKYTLGKRAKAYSQMEKSYKALREELVFEQWMLTFAEKEAVFGWREHITTVSKTGKDEYPDPKTSMRKFCLTPSSTAKTLSSNIADGALKFVQVKYPSAYIW